jgi:hypothetical protein
MNTHFNSFTTNFFENNIFCPRCLSYVAIHDIEIHSEQHERHNGINSFFGFEDDVSTLAIPGLRLRPRTGRPRTLLQSPFSRLAQLNSLYSLGNALTNHNTDSDDDNDQQGGFLYEFNTYIADILGNVEVGISDIDKVSQLVDRETTSNQECHICLDPIQTPRKLICNHTYCDTCITTWLTKNKTCPVCRKDLEELEALKNEEKIED